MIQHKHQWFIVALLIALGFSTRLLPHPPNFAPIGAIALFGALYLPKRWTILVPLAAVFLSDLLIGFYSLPIMFSVYVSFALSGFIGLWIREQKNIRRIIGGTFLSSISFFLATNWAVWAFGTMYPHNLNGLLESYTLALPFFRNSLLGDLFYVGLLVGGHEFVLNRLSRRQLQSQKQNVYPNLPSPYATSPASVRIIR